MKDDLRFLLLLFLLMGCGLDNQEINSNEFSDLEVLIRNGFKHVENDNDIPMLFKVDGDTSFIYCLDSLNKITSRQIFIPFDTLQHSKDDYFGKMNLELINKDQSLNNEGYLQNMKTGEIYEFKVYSDKIELLQYSQSNDIFPAVDPS